MPKIYTILLLIISLTACSHNIKRNLGLEKRSPDEFTVISYPPLDIPPSIQNGEVQEYIATKMPKAKLSEDKMSCQSSRSSDNKLLDYLSHNSRERRTEIVHEQPKAGQKGWIRSTINKMAPDNKDNVVDAYKEKERLEENQKEGKAINSGDVPTINPTPSVLQKLIG